MGSSLPKMKGFPIFYICREGAQNKLDVLNKQNFNFINFHVVLNRKHFNLSNLYVILNKSIQFE